MLPVRGSPGRLTSRSASGSKARYSSTAPGSGSAVMLPEGSCVASPPKRGSPRAAGRTRRGTRLLLLRPMPEFPCGTSKKQPATLIRAPPCATTEDANLSIVTPPTSWPHLSLAPRAELHRSGVRAGERVGTRTPDRIGMPRRSLKRFRQLGRRVLAPSIGDRVGQRGSPQPGGPRHRSWRHRGDGCAPSGGQGLGRVGKQGGRKGEQRGGRGDDGHVSR